MLRGRLPPDERDGHAGLWPGILAHALGMAGILAGVLWPGGAAPLGQAVVIAAWILMLAGDGWLVWMRLRQARGEAQGAAPAVSAANVLAPCNAAPGEGASAAGSPVAAAPAEAAAVRSVHPPAEEARPVRVVAVGGGHGLSTLLRGLKAYTDQITAIVTVADDGGSSGVLRQELGLPPPGDLRDCMAALADAEPLMANLFQYRFGRGTSLDGHSFGNLFIAAMTGITGDFESGLREAGRVLAVRGRILPSSLEPIDLCAEVRCAGDAPGARRLVQGQSRIAAAGGEVVRVYIHPERARGYPEAVRALLRADLVVLGPGSLYTSVLPNLLIPDIREAVRASRGLKIYVCNVATQPGETSGYDLGRHVLALVQHVGEGLCDVVLGNASTDHALPPQSGSTMVAPTWDQERCPRVVLGDLVDASLPWRHDAGKLAAALLAEWDASRGSRAANARP